MAQREYPIALRNFALPMLSEQQTRTIIGSTAGEAPAKEDKPSVAYMHNVMPDSNGLNSVGYKSVIPAPRLPIGEVMVDARIAYSDIRTRLYLAWDSEGNAYALLTGATEWLPLLPSSPITSDPNFSSESVTIGTVNGISYIFFSGLGAFTYVESSNNLQAVTLTGLTIPNILGIVASSGYLIAYTVEAIAWSSTIDPTDFVPSQVTGAGGGDVAGTAGDIIFSTDNSLGVLIYTDANVVAGTYTGNARFPFKFREVPDSKGGINLDRVAYEANSGTQFVYSKAGLQSISAQRAENILPEVTDFLAGKRFEDYNESTLLYEITDLAVNETMNKKIKYVASRYLVISYGLPGTGFTHAIIYDTALNRLGKLRSTHADVFEYIGEQSEISKSSIAFLAEDGSVSVLDFSVSAESNGVLVLGKLQFVRTRFISLEGVEVENVESDAQLDLYTQASLDGKNFTTVQGILNLANPNLRTYHFHVAAKNHSLVFIGKFNSVTAQVKYVVTSRR